MKRLAAFASLIPFLCACDKIDLVAAKGNELNPTKEEAAETKKPGSPQPQATKPHGPPVRQIDNAQFRGFISRPGRLNIIDFYADWCPPCRKIAPDLQALAEEYSDVCRLGKVDVDKEKSLSRAQDVSNIPDIRFYIDGKLVAHFRGAKSRERIRALILEHTKDLEPIVNLDGTPLDPYGIAAGTRSLSLSVTVKPMDKDWIPPASHLKIEP